MTCGVADWCNGCENDSGNSGASVWTVYTPGDTGSSWWREASRRGLSPFFRPSRTGVSLKAYNYVTAVTFRRIDCKCAHLMM